jgi:hypothetical protein
MLSIISRRVCLMLAVLVGLVSLGLAARFWFAPSSPPARADEQAAPSTEKGGPAEQLRVRVQETNEKPEVLLQPDAPVWNQAPATSVLLNRTPRVYQTEPAQQLPIPALEVRALRAGEKLWLRLRWDDATRNAPEAPAAKKGEDAPAHLYKRPTEATTSFADAVAVMFSDEWKGPPFPSLQMGDKNHPVRLFYWNASHGGEELNARGRATIARTGKSFLHRAQHADDHWMLTMQLTAPLPSGTLASAQSPLVPGSPLAFAVWDGAMADRDGRKWFSIWYVLSEK